MSTIGRPRHERRDDIGRLPVQRRPCAVILHRRSRIGVRRRLLHLAERHPGVKRCGDEGVATRVRANKLGDPRTPSDASDDPARALAVQAAAVSGEEDRSLAPLADCEVDRAGRAWGERDRDDLAALAHDGEVSTSAFETKRLEFGTRRP